MGLRAPLLQDLVPLSAGTNKPSLALSGVFAGSVSFFVTLCQIIIQMHVFKLTYSCWASHRQFLPFAAGDFRGLWGLQSDHGDPP